MTRQTASDVGEPAVSKSGGAAALRRVTRRERPGTTTSNPGEQAVSGAGAQRRCLPYERSRYSHPDHGGRSWHQLSSHLTWPPLVPPWAPTSAQLLAYGLLIESVCLWAGE